MSDVRVILIDDDIAGENVPTASFWGGVVFLQEFFEPLVSSLKKFETDLPILSEVYPELFILEKHFERTFKDIEFNQQVHDIFDARWSFLVNDTILLCMSVYNCKCIISFIVLFPTTSSPSRSTSSRQSND